MAVFRTAAATYAFRMRNGSSSTGGSAVPDTSGYGNAMAAASVRQLFPALKKPSDLIYLDASGPAPITIDAAAVVTVTSAAALDAVKTLAAASSITVNRTAAIDKTTSIATNVLTVSVTITADIAFPAKTIDAAQTITVNRTAAVDAVKTLAAAQTVTVNRTAAYDKVTPLDAAQTVTVNRTAAITPTKTLDAAQTVSVNATAAIAVASAPITIVADAAVSVVTTAALSVTKTLAAAAIFTVARTAAISSTVYNAVTSSSVQVAVKTIKTVTEKFYATWGQTFFPDDTWNTFASNESLWQNQDQFYVVNPERNKSLAGFDTVAIIQFLSTRITCTKVKYVFALYDGGHTSGIVYELHARIGTHSNTNRPATWVDANVIQNRVDVKVGDPFYVGVRYSVIDLADPTNPMDTAENLAAEWVAGTTKGLSFGPHNNGGNFYYIKVVGPGAVANAAFKPYIEFEITKWE